MGVGFGPQARLGGRRGLSVGGQVWLSRHLGVLAPDPELAVSGVGRMDARGRRQRLAEAGEGTRELWEDDSIAAGTSPGCLPLCWGASRGALRVRVDTEGPKSVGTWQAERRCLGLLCLPHPQPHFIPGWGRCFPANGGLRLPCLPVRPSFWVLKHEPPQILE